VQVAYFYAEYAPPTWHGLRLLAVDGSTGQLPATPAIVTHFGLHGTVPLARISQMFDTLNKVTIDALIGPPAQGEREYAAQHFAHIGPGDLILLDRGYPAFWLFSLIRTRDADFCARMPVGLWGVVDTFLTTGLAEQIVTLTPCATARADCQTHQVPSHPLQVRLVRIPLDSGEVEVLCTSLLDLERYPYVVFKDLYHQRWPVEEDYKVKYTHQVNFAHLLSKMKDTVVRLLHRTVIADILASLWQIMLRTVEPIRPGRKYPRNKTAKHKRFAMTYKPLR
jgi:hypothetical protein